MGGAGEAWLSGDLVCSLCFFSVRSPLSALRSRMRPRKEKDKEKPLPIPQTPPPRHVRDHRASFPPLLGLPRPGARRAGSVPPALSEESAFSSDPMKGRAWGLPSDPPWVAPARPVTRPMRVALAGFPSPRPDFWGGNPSVCVPAAARASSLRVRGGTTRGKRERAVTPACRAGAWDVVTRGRGTKGPASCARPSAAGPPPVTPLPRGGWCAHASGRGAEREERGWVAVGSRVPPVRTVRARRERSLPRFPVFAVPASAASPCASRACVSLVAACRVESPRSPSPRQRSHDRGAAVTRPSSGPGIRFWRRGPVTSLSGAAFGETAVGRLRRVAGRVGARRRRRSFGGGGRVCLEGGVCASGERRGGPRAFRGTSRGKEA